MRLQLLGARVSARGKRRRFAAACGVTVLCVLLCRLFGAGSFEPVAVGPGASSDAAPGADADAPAARVSTAPVAVAVAAAVGPAAAAASLEASAQAAGPKAPKKTALNNKAAKSKVAISISLPLPFVTKNSPMFCHS